MKRASIRLPERQIDDLDRLVEDGEYPNRSEAVRAAVRELLREERETNGVRLRGRLANK